MDLSGERDVAISAVRAAAKYCTRVQETMLAAVDKVDRSPVTVGDYGAQAIICHRVHEAFADDAILAEEHATELLAGGGDIGESLLAAMRGTYDPAVDMETICGWIDVGAKEAQRRWILDPVDGTKGFLRREQYAIALALMDGDEMVLGVLGCPALPGADGRTGCLFVAEKGAGTVEMPLDGGTGSAIRVSPDQPGAEMVFVESVESGHTDHAANLAIVEALGVVREPVRYDSQAKYAVVARGEATAYLRLPNPETPDYHEKLWDHAAGMLVVTEAGGRVTDVRGADLDFRHATRLEDNRGVIASNGLCHDAILEAVSRAI